MPVVIHDYSFCHHRIERETRGNIERLREKERRTTSTLLRFPHQRLGLLALWAREKQHTRPRSTQFIHHMKNYYTPRFASFQFAGAVSKGKQGDTQRTRQHTPSFIIITPPAASTLPLRRALDPASTPHRSVAAAG